MLQDNAGNETIRHVEAGEPTTAGTGETRRMCY
jgi:hypothetical protein